MKCWKCNTEECSEDCRNIPELMKFAEQAFSDIVGLLEPQGIHLEDTTITFDQSYIDKNRVAIVAQSEDIIVSADYEPAATKSEERFLTQFLQKQVENEPEKKDNDKDKLLFVLNEIGAAPSIEPNSDVSVRVGNQDVVFSFRKGKFKAIRTRNRNA